MAVSLIDQAVKLANDPLGASKKRKAPYDPVHDDDERPAKAVKSAQYAIDLTWHPSYMVTITTAVPPAKLGGEHRVVDVRVVGTFVELAQAQVALRDSMNAQYPPSEVPKSGDFLSTFANAIHATSDCQTGALRVIQRDLPAPDADTTTRTEWLRIGEILPKEAIRIQQTIQSNSVYLVVSNQTMQVGSRDTVEDSQVVAVYRTAHEANQFAIRQFNEYGGPLKISGEKPSSPYEDVVDEEEGEDEDEDDEEYGDDDTYLRFSNGMVEASAGGEEEILQWTVVQQTVL